MEQTAHGQAPAQESPCPATRVPPAARPHPPTLLEPFLPPHPKGSHPGLCPSVTLGEGLIYTDPVPRGTAGSATHTHPLKPPESATGTVLWCGKLPSRIWAAGGPWCICQRGQALLGSFHNHSGGRGTVRGRQKPQKLTLCPNPCSLCIPAPPALAWLAPAKPGFSPGMFVPVLCWGSFFMAGPHPRRSCGTQSQALCGPTILLTPASCRPWAAIPLAASPAFQVGRNHPASQDLHFCGPSSARSVKCLQPPGPFL